MDKFKEEVIFELEKDSKFEGFRDFRARCIRKYDYTPSTELCIKINNYQIDTYGSILNNSASVPYRKNFKAYQSHKRIMSNINSQEHRQQRRFIERANQHD